MSVSFLLVHDFGPKLLRLTGKGNFVCAVIVNPKGAASIDMRWSRLLELRENLK